MNETASEKTPVLMQELRAATAPAHAGLDGAPFFQALSAGELPLESYVGQLRALSVIHGVLEEALSTCADARVGSVWSDDMRKLPLLQQDLRHFEPQLVKDLKEAIVAAMAVETDIRLRLLERPLSLIGYHYVLEGSTLGAQVLRPMVARTFKLTDDGLAYLSSYGSEVRVRWARLGSRVNALSLTPTERKEVVEAAVACFAKLAALFGTLYPVTSESKTLLATSINPEAGRHPVPDDPREIEAAVRAGDRCWQAFPYCEQRFGERGRRFSRSDAAWKATLYRLPKEQILEQVWWLGRLLAARGLPTVMLQVTLEILVEELSRAVPERSAEYARLLRASADLLASRRAHLTDDQLQVLATDFDRAVGPSLSARLPRTALLLGCAVTDELAGCEGAVSSLRPWMIDAARFPPEWVAAVEATLIRAREFTRLNSSTRNLP